MGFDVWYVIQVITGREQKTVEDILDVVPHEVLQECFFPQYTTEIKIKGQWVAIDKPMFPGYLIAVTDDPYGLDRELRKLNHLRALFLKAGFFCHSIKVTSRLSILVQSPDIALFL